MASPRKLDIMMPITVLDVPHVPAAEVIHDMSHQVPFPEHRKGHEIYIYAFFQQTPPLNYTMESINRTPIDEKPLLEDYDGALPVHSMPEVDEALARRERRRHCWRKSMRKIHGIILLGAFYYLIRFVAFPAAFKFVSRCHKNMAGSELTIDTLGEPIPDDVHIVACHEWSQETGTDSPWKHLNEELATFELPVSSKSLFFLSRGYSTSGSVTVFSHAQLLEGTEVCQITHEEGENGVGIFTRRLDDQPRHPRRRRHLGFNVTIYLPKASNIKSFETDMPLFVHVLEDLAEAVNFKSISLNTVHTPIYVKSVSADSASFRTANSPIHGVFNTSSSLTLSTSNSPIKAHIGLLNGEDSEDFTTSICLLPTRKPSAVEAQISLLSKEESGGRFKVTSHNSVTHLNIEFPTAPVNSVLILDAKTSVSPVVIKLHETYEGKFSFETSLSRPYLVVNDKVEDPSGEGRTRNVNVSHVGSKVVGAIGWSEEGKDVGDVNVKTSISPLTLYV
ncbi:hypothetical protein BDQ17DRAFT_1432586 [Cyathus striatus]|nr:hypothetical protein BDQ17DRAFT_1432586 [Cyathus striatus]